MAIKTLHLTNAYHPTSGGIRTFYRALLARANDEQRFMRLVVPADRDDVEEVGRFGRVYHLAAPAAPVFDRRYRLLYPTQYLRARTRLRAILQDEQPDLIEICDKYTLPYLAALIRKGWASGLRRPVLVGLSCERMDDNVAAYVGKGALGRSFSRAYLRRIYGPAFDSHIAVSEYTADELRRSLWDRSTDFIRVSPMGVESTAFGPVHRDPALRRTLLEAAGGTRDSALLLYVGRLSPEKNPRLLIETLEVLSRPRRAGRLGDRDYRLILAGDGPSVRPLLDEARQIAKGRVHWLGAIRDRAEVARLYASADLFVHPNPREPFGIAPLEAMASRLPVVLPSAGGVQTFATPQNSWLAAPDARSFAFAIRTAMAVPDQARIAAAFETARAFDWSKVTARFFKLYDDIHARHVSMISARMSKFAPSTTVSHTVVTELGQSAFQEGR